MSNAVAKAGSMTRMPTATNFHVKEARMQQNAGARGGNPPAPAPSSRRSALDARQYDSFVVRVWRHPGDDRLIRAEVRHVQSGASQSAIDCDVSWIGQALGHLLQERDARQGH